jgi:hypothetical protein
MRISMREFVPAEWTVPQNPITGGMGALAALADFVNAKYAVPQDPVSDAQRRRGTGDFVWARYVVPQNPVSDAQQRLTPMCASGCGSKKRGTGDFVPGLFAVPQDPVSDANRQAARALGTLVPSAPMYPIPENSVLAAFQAQGLAGLGCGCQGDNCSSCGCGCGGGLGQVSTELSQIGTDISAGNWAQALGTDTIFSIPVWIYLAGGALLWVGIFSGGEHSRYSRARKAGSRAISTYSS